MAWVAAFTAAARSRESPREETAEITRPFLFTLILTVIGPVMPEFCNAAGYAGSGTTTSSPARAPPTVKLGFFVSGGFSTGFAATGTGGASRRKKYPANL